MVRVMLNTFRTVRVVLPWVLRALWFTLTIMAMTVSSLWVGVPSALDRISNEWLDRAEGAGFPKELLRPLYYIVWVVGLAAMILGWIFLSYATVWLVNRLLL